MGEECRYAVMAGSFSSFQKMNLNDDLTLSGSHDQALDGFG